MMTEEDQEDWKEFNRWMSQEPTEECLYIWLRWEGGTFVLDPAAAEEKALERFRVWQRRKRGVEQAKVIQLAERRSRPKPKRTNITLQDLGL